jgi:hypothetical protein
MTELEAHFTIPDRQSPWEMAAEGCRSKVKGSRPNERATVRWFRVVTFFGTSSAIKIRYSVHF